MKLKHLLQSINADLVDAQLASYHRSEKLAYENTDSLFPIPLASFNDIELTLQFAFERTEEDGMEMEINRHAFFVSLKPKLKRWMREVFIDDIPAEEYEKAKNVDKLILEIEKWIIAMLYKKWPTLIDADLALKKKKFIAELVKFDDAPLVRKRAKSINFSKELQKKTPALETIIAERVGEVEELIQNHTKLKKSSVVNVIVDAEQLQKIPTENIHTAKILFKVDEIDANSFNTIG